MKSSIPFRTIFLLLVILRTTLACQAGIISKPAAVNQERVLTEACDLAKRVLGDRARAFIFQRFESDTLRNVFELSALGDKVVIRGNTGIDLASGLNWYLKSYCHCQFTVTDEQLALPDTLPLPAAPRLVRTPYKFRYFFNVCTFGYTMAWWGWKEWERQIDWMAMNGINLPLAITGQEAVWYEVYRELGLTDAQIGTFIPGPAYFPWGWMGNIDGFGGPLPASWRTSHARLQQQIVSRERALGMTPVLQGFTGHVPDCLANIFPGARIHK